MNTPQKQKVAFLYSKIHRNLGSKKMRCDQLSELARTHLSNKYEFETFLVPMSLGPQLKLAQTLEGHIIIFLKHALERMHEEPAQLLRKNAKAMCIDYVDVGPSNKRTSWYDCHIAASRVLEDELRAYFEETPEQLKEGSSVSHITHGPDIYLRRPTTSRSDVYNIGYLGSESSLLLPEELSDNVDILSYEITKAKDGLSNISDYPIQYAVRPGRSRNRFALNPLTKGFNAAVLGQNILINRQAVDSVHYLGEDYPFLIDDTNTDTVRAGLLNAKTLFGTSEWQRGLEIMDQVRDKSSPEIITSELDDILRKLS